MLGFKIPGICFTMMSPSFLQSCMAKYWMSKCHVRSVGEILLLIICRVDILSIWIGVGEFCLYSNCFKTIQRYLAIFEPTCAAINSTSVKLPAAKD